eukprot:CAMPEP_0170507404 /NCGR_PEP_ID=MMETSP0208-20121228/58707_1 /TAXON_ID=197538 /ORGANISM="Strombidium inclinatum, Strain S3" /LENGTH=158 /DNA_ID=CAMNT_0010789557 /DNA_START=278 /DNA_END=754 /DNA_ORIENTATION=+
MDGVQLALLTEHLRTSGEGSHLDRDWFDRRERNSLFAGPLLGRPALLFIPVHDEKLDSRDLVSSPGVAYDLMLDSQDGLAQDVGWRREALLYEGVLMAWIIKIDLGPQLLGPNGSDKPIDNLILLRYEVFELVVVLDHLVPSSLDVMKERAIRRLRAV